MSNMTAAFGSSMLTATLIAIPLVVPGQVAEDDFTLSRYVPQDVFVFVAQKHNPEQDFLYEYWGDVCEALAESGLDDDIMSLFSMALGADQEAEVKRLREKATELIAGVNWDTLGGQEFGFGQRFHPPDLTFTEDPMLIASLIFMFRGTEEGAAENYAGLQAILRAIVEEINNAAGVEAMVVRETTRHGTQLTSVNLLEMVPGAPKLPIAVGLRGDIVLMSMRDDLLLDTLQLLDGSSEKTSLAKDQRFQSALAQLPEPEDTIEFFDAQELINPISEFMNKVIEIAQRPHDVTRNTGMDAAASGHHRKALAAYRKRDYKQALASSQEAHKTAPESSLNLYNLACFHALNGNHDEALEWLGKAVDAGFCAPRKITKDTDFTNLRSDPRFDELVERATTLAREYRADDLVINSSKSGESYRIVMQARQAFDAGDYKQGLQLGKQAYDTAPRDSRVLYTLACAHAQLNHSEEALEFLGRAVEGGYYCPKHISRDGNLHNLQDNSDYQVILAKARRQAASHTGNESGEWSQLAKAVLDRLTDAVGIMDYAATVSSTDGYSTYSETISVLVPDARSKPVYAVFGNAPSMTNFERYLPVETSSFSVSGGFNFEAFYEFVEGTLEQGGPAGAEVLKRWDEIQREMGFNIRADVLDWIAGEFVEVTLEDGSTVFMMSVSNEDLAREKMTVAIEALTGKMSKAISENQALAMLAMFMPQISPLEHDELKGFQSVRFSMIPEPMVWGVADKQLIMASSADTAALCLATARGEHPNIRQNERAMREMVVPDGPFVAVSLTNLRTLSQELSAGIGVGSMVFGMMTAQIPEEKPRKVLGKVAGMIGKLIPVVQEINFFKSTASCIEFNETGWRMKVVTHYLSPDERAALKGG